MTDTDHANMTGKTVIVTGANSGIGKEAAIGLAALGARVVITARDPARGSTAHAEIVARSGSETVELMELDLASFDSIRRFATEALDRFDAIHVLVNNAGLTLSRRTTTQEGFETTFGVNHLGHFYLTALLRDRLQRSAPSRVVTVASHAHTYARRGLDFDDLMYERRRYQGFLVYGASKLANILFTVELADQLAGTGVTANALHPGFVATNFGRDGDTNVMSMFAPVIRPFAIGEQKGARTTVYLCSSADVEEVSGGYFVKCRPRDPSAAARNRDAARRLWEISEELIAAHA